MNELHPRLFTLVRHEDVTGISGTGVVADGVCWPDGAVAVRWRGERQSTVVWQSMDDVQAIHGHGGATSIVWDDYPRADLTRLPEMDGYLSELAAEIGDRAPLEFWFEIRRSITEPTRLWLRGVMGKENK